MPRRSKLSAAAPKVEPPSSANTDNNARVVPRSKANLPAAVKAADKVEPSVRPIATVCPEEEVKTYEPPALGGVSPSPAPKKGRRPGPGRDVGASSDVPVAPKPEKPDSIKNPVARKSRDARKKDLRSDTKAVPKRNEKTMAAIAAHKHPDKNHFPLVEYRIPKSREFTAKKIELLNKVHPCKLEDLHSFAQSNEHPLCAAARSIGEAYAINEAINTLADANLKPDWILDVGGAGRRHINMKRKYMWSCIPTQSAKDELRRFSIPPGQHCEHDWLSCDCHQFPISISVHALYYIHPRTILKQLLKQTIPVHYALLHRYSGQSGTMMDGEMEFTEHGESTYVKAAGNIHPYVQPNMHWLEDGMICFPEGTLIWEKCRGFLDSEVLRFHATTKTIPVLKPCLPTPKPVMELECKFETQKFDDIVNECILYHREINTFNHNKFLEAVRRKGLANKLNIGRLTEYADHAYMNQKTTLVPVTDLTQRTAYDRLQRLKMLRDDYQHLLYFAGAMGLCLVAIVTWYYPHMVYELIVPHIGPIIFGLVALAMFYLLHETPCRSFREFDNALPRTLSLFDLLNNKAYGWTGKAKVVNFCCAMPDKETDPNKLVALRVPNDFEEECEATDAAYAMVYSPNHAPYFPRNCSHNVVKSIKNKLGQKIPGAGTYTMKLHPLLAQIALEANGAILPLSWEEWVSRFPGPKQARLRKEEEDNRDFLMEDWNASKFFTKFEAYAEPKYSRPIISSKVEFNFSIGRWLIPIAEFLAGNLPENLMFPIHGDSEEIGAFRSQYCGYVEMDCDFKSFDSSQTAGALEIVFTFLELAGVPKVVVDRCRKDKTFCVIRNRKGLKVIMKGCRFSGRSETLLGNTLITLNTALNMFGPALMAALVKGDDVVLYLELGEYDVEMYKAKYLEQGLVAKLRRVDDLNVEFCSSVFIPSAYDHVLVVKPGKLIAKTFWCKNLEYGPIEMEKQFASILKGLACSLENLPGLRGLYRNPVYLRWFPTVDAHYDQYNEYARSTVTYDDAAIEFILARYDITLADLEELEDQLASSFPIRLDCIAATAMIEKDWAEANDGEHLIEFPQERRVDLRGPLVEELFAYVFPTLTALFLGIGEFYLTGDLFHLVGHLILFAVRHYCGFSIAMIVHMLNNWFAGTRQLSLMANRKQRNRKPKAKKPKKRTGGRSQRFSPYHSMVASPCDSQLVQGIFGDASGMLAKYKTIETFGEAQVCGFALWSPNGVTTAGGNGYKNMIYFANDNPSTLPTNTGANPYGSVSANTTGLSIGEGANQFVTGSTCADFRTISACMKLTYVGTTSSCAGRVAIIEGLPTVTLLKGHGGSPMSINDMFSYSGSTTRVGLDPMEVRLRPNTDHAHFYKNENSAPLETTAGGTILGSDENRFGEVWFGFAWQGIDTTKLVFEFIQNIEWRPEANLGFVGNPGHTSSSTDVLKSVVQQLDAAAPGWSNHLKDGIHSLGSSVTAMALAGAGTVYSAPRLAPAVYRGVASAALRAQQLRLRY